jgi:hypothetical protein
MLPDIPLDFFDITARYRFENALVLFQHSRHLARIGQVEPSEAIDVAGSSRDQLPEWEDPGSLEQREVKASAQKMKGDG